MLLRRDQIVDDAAHDLEVERLGNGRSLAEGVWHRLDAVPGRKRKRNAALSQSLCDRKAIVVAKCHIEDSGIDRCRSDEFESLTLGMRRPDRLVTIFRKEVAQHHRDERLI